MFGYLLNQSTKPIDYWWLMFFFFDLQSICFDSILLLLCSCCLHFLFLLIVLLLALCLLECEIVTPLSWWKDAFVFFVFVYFWFFHCLVLFLIFFFFICYFVFHDDLRFKRYELIFHFSNLVFRIWWEDSQNFEQCKFDF